MIENIKSDEDSTQESNYKNLQLSQNIILKQTSSTQNKTSFTNPENKIKLGTADTYIGENSSLDKTVIKEPIDNNNDKAVLDLKSIVNEDILPLYNSNKSIVNLNEQGIEQTKYDIVATVTNKLHINNERV